MPYKDITYDNGCRDFEERIWRRRRDRDFSFKLLILNIFIYIFSPNFPVVPLVVPSGNSGLSIVG